MTLFVLEIFINAVYLTLVCVYIYVGKLCELLVLQDRIAAHKEVGFML